MLNIALDGPSGAGKSTIARQLAQRLGILYLDTGAMYRAMGYKALQQGIDPKDTTTVDRLAAETEIDVRCDGSRQITLLDGIDVSDVIRTPEVAQSASAISAVHSVRIKLVESQRMVAQKNDLVMDGRDIGTYVLPHTPYKFFLTAQPQERAHRRWLELREKGIETTEEEVLRDQLARDKQDEEREFAPLCKAKDAIEIDSTGLSIEQVAEKILSYLKVD